MLLHLSGICSFFRHYSVSLLISLSACSLSPWSHIMLPLSCIESSKKSSNTVPVLWKCSMCTFDNHETMVYCEMCGVFRESFVKSGKDVSIKGI